MAGGDLMSKGGLPSRHTKLKVMCLSCLIILSWVVSPLGLDIGSRVGVFKMETLRKVQIIHDGGGDERAEAPSVNQNAAYCVRAN